VKLEDMSQERLYKALFQTMSVLTDRFPRAGARFLNAVTTRLLGNQFVAKACLRKNVNRLKRVKEFRRILVIGDMNIGDAINLQAAISGLRDFFPEAEIDYIMNRFAANLVDGNDEISNLWPVFTGHPLPNNDDIGYIERVLWQRRYDIIFNFCPFLNQHGLFFRDDNIINFLSFAPIFIGNERTLTRLNHVVYQTHQIIHKLFLDFMTPERKEVFKGVKVTLSDSAIKQAQTFLASKGLLKGGPLILYNPDAASRFSRIPFELQGSIIRQLAQLPSGILLGAGHTAKKIEIDLLNFLPPSQRSNIVIIPPSMPLDCYTALIDFYDLFITGDTGPLHIAAAHKSARSKNYTFRNKTAIFSIFGASSGRIYGYASDLPGFFPANQQAPSYVYIAKSPCRNITCINKMAKTCKTVRCFDSLDTEKLLLDIESYLSRVRGAAFSHFENKEGLTMPYS
jgi:ADP-heptose:LPS heptosyltransferase